MFIYGNKCTALVGDVDMGEAVQEQEQEIHVKSLYLLLNVAVNL